MYKPTIALIAALIIPPAVPATAQAINNVAQTGVGVTSPTSALVTVSYTNEPLVNVLKGIAQQARVRLSFSGNDLQGAKRVTVDLKDVALPSAFAQVLKGTRLTAVPVSADAWTVVLSKQDGRKSVQGVIVGKITDAKTGKGLAGANISVGNDGVVSRDDGTYRVAGVSIGAQTITVRMMGYAKQTRSVTVGEGATLAVDFKLEPSANVLDQVVVTGSVVATELKAVPNAITVVTAKQIEERGITRIDQLFRGDIPGLFSLNLGSSSQVDQVMMFSRGATALSATSIGVTDPNTGISFNTNPIKTYIDGIEMADSRYLSQIDPGSIDRIEILTGPQASTIYGSNAINGVMQIFTKRGSGNKPQLAFNLTTGVIQNNFSNALAPTHISDTRISGAEGRLSYNLGGSWNYEGAWTPGKQTQRLNVYGGGRMDMGQVTVDLSVRNGSTTTQENGNISEGRTDLRSKGFWLPSALNGLPMPRLLTLNGRTFGLALSYRPFSWWSHDLTLGSDGYHRENLSNAPGFSAGSGGADTGVFVSSRTTNRISQSYNNTMQLSVSDATRLNLIFGGDHWTTSGSSWSASPVLLTGTFSSADFLRLTRDKSSKNGGMYFQGQLGFFEELFLTYGLRADWNPSFGDNAKVKPGRYGMSYAKDFGVVSAKIRGSYGRSIRPPADGAKLAIPASSIYGSAVINQFGPFDYTLSNPDLGPEHQQGGEGGIEMYIGNRGSLIITRFNQTVDNLISQVLEIDSVRSILPVAPVTNNCTSSGSNYFDNEGHCYFYLAQYLNVGSIRNQGWEMQGSVSFGPFTTRGTYSWVKSRVLGITPKYRAFLEGSQFEPGRPFDYLPEHTWALGVTYSQSRSMVSLSVNGVGMRYIADNLGFASSLSRFQLLRPRMQSLSEIYRPLSSGYATADLNAAYRFSSGVDGVLQVMNLTDYYHNDYDTQYAAVGRSSKVGVRLKW